MKEEITELISAEAIAEKVGELGAQITKDYEGKDLTLICILKGGAVFMVDIARAIKLSVNFEFMGISSYGMQSKSSGVVKIERDLQIPITGKHVILVEDIIDTGHTLSYLTEHLMAQNPASLKLCALLDKKSRREVDGIEPDYVGFEIPDHFVVGYGLDYAQQYRNLPFVGALEFEEEQ